MRRLLVSATFFLAIVATGCASLAGKLRRDFDDGEPYYSSGPTSGGVWQERGFLSESMPEGGRGYPDRYGALGHSERHPASGSYGPSARRESWVSSTQADAQRREQLGRDFQQSEEDEEAPSYSTHPNLAPGSKRLYKNGMRATRADFVDDAPNEGSLWASDGQTNYYFTKNKIRGVGDIITIQLDEEMVRDFGQEVKRNLTPGERQRELSVARDRLRGKLAAVEQQGAGRGPAAVPGAPAQGEAKEAEEAASRTVAPGIELPEPTSADIDVTKALELKAGDTMLAEIIERYPNGNYKVRGTKKVVYRNGNPRIVNLLGIARGNDISEEDVITSGKLYEYRLEAYR